MNEVEGGCFSLNVIERAFVCGSRGSCSGKSWWGHCILLQSSFIITTGGTRQGPKEEVIVSADIYILKKGEPENIHVGSRRDGFSNIVVLRNLSLMPLNNCNPSFVSRISSQQIRILG